MGIMLWSVAAIFSITGLACALRYKLTFATVLITSAAVIGLYAGSLLP